MVLGRFQQIIMTECRADDFLNLNMSYFLFYFNLVKKDIHKFLYNFFRKTLINSSLRWKSLKVEGGKNAR